MRKISGPKNSIGLNVISRARTLVTYPMTPALGRMIVEVARARREEVYFMPREHF
jgi:hypothetical protein